MPQPLHFPVDIIAHGAWLYDRFTLSDRDVQERRFERGTEDLRRNHLIRLTTHRCTITTATITPHTVSAMIVSSRSR